LGILIKAKREGFSVDISDAIRNMRNKGIWISPDLEAQIIKESVKH
jgi:predicted nucleic acid-binding protein